MKVFSDVKVRRHRIAAAFSACLVIGSASAQQHSYLIDLNSKTATEVGAGTDNDPYSINDAGQIVGWRSAHAFITGPNGAGMRDIDTLDNNNSYASGVNAIGQVSGSFYTAGGSRHAFMTGPNGTDIKDLGTLPGYSISQAYGINDIGQVVGNSYNNGNIFLPRAFITDPNGGDMRDLGSLGGNGGQAFAINSAGQVVGQSDTAGGVVHAFITGPDGIGMRDLGSLWGVSFAFGINSAGQVVGQSDTAGGAVHAFITGPDGVGMRDLGTLGGSDSAASGINTVGQVVGISYTAGGAHHAFITGPDGTGMMDLNSLIQLPGVILTSAVAIKNVGQVIAVGTIPEPEIYALFLSGLVLIGFMARRKKMDVRSFSMR